MKKTFPRIVLACALAALAFVFLPVLASLQSSGNNENLSPQAGNRPDILWMRGGFVNLAMSRSADGQIIATAGGFPTIGGFALVKIWRSSDDKLLRSINPLGDAKTLSLSADGTIVAVGVNADLKIFQVSDGSLLRTIPNAFASSALIGGIAISPDKQYVAAIPLNGCGASMFRISDGAFIHNFAGQAICGSIAFSPNSQLIAGAGSNGIAKIFSASTGTLIRNMPDIAFGSLTFSPDGLYLAGSSGLGTRVFRVSDGSTVGLMGDSDPDQIPDVAFSPNGQYLAVGIDSGYVKLWHVSGSSTWSLGTHFQAHIDDAAPGVTRVIFNAANELITSKYLTKVWNPSNGSLIRQIEAHTTRISAVAFSPDGQMFATGTIGNSAPCSESNAVRVWRTSDSALLNTFIFSTACGTGISSITFSANNQFLIAGGNEVSNGGGFLKKWRLSDNSQIFSISLPTGSGSNFVASPDKQLLAFGRSTLTLRSSADGSVIRTLINGQSSNPLAFSSDNQKIAVSRAEQFTSYTGLYSVSDGAVLQTFANSGMVTVGALSPDSQIFVGGEDRRGSGTNPPATIRQWRVSDGALQQSFVGHTLAIQDLKFTPDGQKLVSTGWDSTIRFWQVSNAELLQTFDEETLFDYFNTGATAISPDGSRFAYGRYDGVAVMARNPYPTTPPTNYTISGQISRSNSAVSGVSVTLSGDSSDTKTTDANGNYSFTVLEGGSYTVTPQLANNTFAPASQTFNFVSQNQTADFAASYITYTIGGNVKADGANLSGATVTLSGSQSQTATTDANGNYNFTANAGGDYTISVSKNNIIFNPASQSFTNLQANQTADFQTGTSLCAPPPTGLAAWYKMENNGNDSSGKGNNGNISVTGFGQGFNGLAMYTAGAQYMTVADNVSLRPASITVDGWFKMTGVPSSGNFYNLASKYGGDFQGWILRYRNDQAISFEVYRPSIGAAAVSSVTVPVNTWVHIAGSYDGTNLKLYINGILRGSSTFAGGYSPSTIPMQLGKASWTNGEFSSAQIDEFQIFNRALSASEVQSIYNAGSAGVCALGSVDTPVSANGKIAFRSNRTGNGEIFTMNEDGSGQTDVSNNGAEDVVAAWSPNGSKIAFVSFRNNNYDIYTINADGTNETRLTTHPGADDMPSWSPDGSRIIFASSRDGNTEIYVMNADGTSQTRITNNSGEDYFPSFSPDGNRIIFGSNRSGNFEIWAMNADGTNPVNLSNNSSIDFEPSLSPDGSKIAFRSHRSGNQDIWLMNSDGTNPINLSNNPAADLYPAFSPDGGKIAFTSDRNGNTDIYVMSAADGSMQNRLTTDAAIDRYPSWQRAAVMPVANVNLNFGNVTQAGNTTATSLTASQLPALPAGYSLTANSLAYDIRTSAAYSGNITVTFNVQNVANASVCSRLRSLHYETSGWTTNTNAAPIYDSQTQVCTVAQTVASLSPFVVALAPAQTYTISGQITFNASPLPGVSVALTGSATDTKQSDAQGNYSFTVEEEGNYIVTPSLQNYSFTPPSQTFNNLTANQTANFTAVSTCTYSLMPNGTSAPAAASTGGFTLNTQDGCAWTAAANQNWITVTSAASGAGTQTIEYAVAANAGGQRSGSITAAGQNFLITQSAAVYNVSGAIVYGTTPQNQPQRFVAGVLLSASGAGSDSDTSIAAGTYLLGNLNAGGTYLVTPSKTGNANGITSFDAALVLRCVAAGAGCTLTPNQQAAADTDGSPGITSFDVVLILRYVAANGANANTGQAGKWKFSPSERNYPALDGNRSEQDYTAFLIGEVDGDWTPPSNDPQQDVSETEINKSDFGRNETSKRDNEN